MSLITTLLVQVFTLEASVVERVAIENGLQIFRKNLPFSVVNTRRNNLPKVLCDEYSELDQSIHVCTINAEIAHRLLNDKRSQQPL